MPIHDLPGVVAAFGFAVHHVDGHNYHEIINVLNDCRGSLSVIFAKTTKGHPSKHLLPETHPITKLPFQPW